MVWRSERSLTYAESQTLDRPAHNVVTRNDYAILAPKTHNIFFNIASIYVIHNLYILIAYDYFVQYSHNKSQNCTQVNIDFNEMKFLL